MSDGGLHAYFKVSDLFGNRVSGDMHIDLVVISEFCLIFCSF